MRLMNRKPEDDMAQKWLNELQNRFELNAEEANDLYALTRTCFAHNFGEADFKTVVLRYLSQTGKKVTPDAIDTSSMFIYRAGGRRYEKWSWQENSFGVLSCVLAVCLFLIDIFTYGWESNIVALIQFLAVFLVFIMYILADFSSRGYKKEIILFSAINRFMPGLTMITYLVFHFLKWALSSIEIVRWKQSMLIVVGGYVVLSIVLAYLKLKEYKKAVALLHTTTMESQN